MIASMELQQSLDPIPLRPQPFISRVIAMPWEIEFSDTSSDHGDISDATAPATSSISGIPRKSRVLDETMRIGGGGGDRWFV